MLIDISQLLSVEDKKESVEAVLEMKEFVSKTDKGVIKECKPFIIELKNKGKKKIKLDTVIDLTLTLPCSRCLKDVDIHMHMPVNKTIDMNDKGDRQDYDADENSFITDDSIDVERLVYEEILVNMPMKVLCDENCEGIYNRCGTDETTDLDPRMSKIRDIFNNFKEV